MIKQFNLSVCRFRLFIPKVKRAYYTGSILSLYNTIPAGYVSFLTIFVSFLVLLIFVNYVAFFSLFGCQFVRLSVCLLVCLLFCLLFSLLYTNFSSVFLSVYLPDCASLCWSLCFSIRLSLTEKQSSSYV